MTDQIETPPALEIVDGTAKEQGGAAMRDVLLIVGTLPALLAVLGTRDVTKVVAYIGSVEFAPALGVLILAGTVLWRQLITRWAKRKLITTADAAPASVAVVIQK